MKNQYHILKEQKFKFPATNRFFVIQSVPVCFLLIKCVFFASKKGERGGWKGGAPIAVIFAMYTVVVAGKKSHAFYSHNGRVAWQLPALPQLDAIYQKIESRRGEAHISHTKQFAFSREKKS